MLARSRERSALGSRTLDASGESQRAPPPRSRADDTTRPANLSAGLPGLAGDRRTASVLAPLNDARPALEHQSHDVGWQRAR